MEKCNSCSIRWRRNVRIITVVYYTYSAPHGTHDNEMSRKYVLIDLFTLKMWMEGREQGMTDEWIILFHFHFVIIAFSILNFTLHRRVSLSLSLSMANFPIRNDKLSLSNGIFPPEMFAFLAKWVPRSTAWESVVTINMFADVDMRKQTIFKTQRPLSSDYAIWRGHHRHHHRICRTWCFELLFNVCIWHDSNWQMNKQSRSNACLMNAFISTCNWTVHSMESTIHVVVFNEID